MAVDVGTGTIVHFLGSPSGGWTGQVTDFNIDGEEVAVVDVSHLMTTGYREKIFGRLIEPPQFTANLNYDPQNEPPIGVTDTIVVTWPGGGTLTGTGAIISRNSETPLEDKMTGSFVFQFDGRTGPTYAG